MASTIPNILGIQVRPTTPPDVEMKLDKLPGLGDAGAGVAAEEVDDRPQEYLDGGFGWAIVASTSHSPFSLGRSSHPAQGTFVIAFHFLGYLYAWGVIQAHLLSRGLATSQLLSVIGGLQAFFNAAGCIPVSRRLFCLPSAYPR